jgi:hypothetical protein
MRPPLYKLATYLLCALALVGAAALEARAKTHYVLLDVSGSMKERYENSLRNWLVEPLLKSSAFSPGDRVIVRWFHARGDAKFDPNDQQRKYDGKYDVRAILDRVPAVQDAVGGKTDIPEALELTLGDITKLPVTDDVLIWLVTDNEQDTSSGASVDPLYLKIKDDQRFQSAYVFPLTRENNAQLPPQRDAMVMYLLQFSTKLGRPSIDSFADDAGRKIGNAPITWFPVEKWIDLDDTNIRVNDEQIMMVDGRLKMPPVKEGEPPVFTFQFPFKSNLRNLKIAESKITTSPAPMRLPDTVEAVGDLDSWHVDIAPKTLTIEPGKKSEVVYNTKMAGDMTLKPASFWGAVWNSTSDPVEIAFEYKLVDVKASIDRSTLNQVKNLDGIEKYVRQSRQTVRSHAIPMSFQVEYNSLWRRLLAGGLGLLLVGAAAGGAGVFLAKGRYQLSTPFGEETLMLPLVGRSYVTINGERAAVIKRQFGKLSVAPLGSYTVNGTLIPLRLGGQLSAFELANPVDNRRYQYTLTRAAGRAEQVVRRDDFLD